MSTPKYGVYQSGVEWRWRLKAINGQVISSGEGYKSKQGALRGVAGHTRSAMRARIVVLKSTTKEP